MKADYKMYKHLTLAGEACNGTRCYLDWLSEKGFVIMLEQKIINVKGALNESLISK